jgi:DNA-binding transcriptional LysR family regulator
VVAPSHLKSLQALEVACRLGSLQAAARALGHLRAAFREAHPNISFCINGEGDAPLRIGTVDCELSFARLEGFVSRHPAE